MVESCDRAYQRGVGSCARELVEAAVVNVQHLLASPCNFEPCRAQEERPQANEGLVAAVGAERMKPIARLVV